MEINNLEEFWTLIDTLRQEKELTWTGLVGASNTKAAKQKKLNPSLKKLLELQEKLNVNLIRILPYDTFSGEGHVERDPETAKKMARIKELISEDDWTSKPDIVKKVQKIGKTIR